MTGFLGRHSKRVLLTAGWTVNWNGLLARQVWHYLTSDPRVQANQALRTALLGTPTLNFEEAYELVATGPGHNFSAADKATLDAALSDIFVMIDDALITSAFPVNTYKVNEFISYFVRVANESINTGYLFTLNQDLFFERKYIQHVIHQVPPPVLPGIPPHGGIFNPNMPRFDAKMIANIPLKFSQCALVRQTNVIKLHGSFNWRSNGSASMMVIGTNKTPLIAGSDVLSWYFDIFKAVLNEGDVKLMIVGYSFGDDHVNEIIADAVVNSGLRIYFWDTNPNLHTTLAGRHRGTEIWQGYLGSLTERMDQVFPPDQSITPYCRSLFSNFFGVSLP
jgi:SIR2-like domain